MPTDVETTSNIRNHVSYKKPKTDVEYAQWTDNYILNKKNSRAKATGTLFQEISRHQFPAEGNKDMKERNDMKEIETARALPTYKVR